MACILYCDRMLKNLHPNVTAMHLRNTHNASRVCGLRKTPLLQIFENIYQQGIGAPHK